MSDFGKEVRHEHSSENLTAVGRRLDGHRHGDVFSRERLGSAPGGESMARTIFVAAGAERPGKTGFCPYQIDVRVLAGLHKATRAFQLGFGEFILLSPNLENPSFLVEIPVRPIGCGYNIYNL